MVNSNKYLYRKSIVKPMQFYNNFSVQGLAFKGHRQSRSFTNKGNYLTCLDYLA